MTMYTLQLIVLFTLLGLTLAAAAYAAWQARRGRQAAQEAADTLATYSACLSGIATAVKSPVIVPTGGGPIHPPTPV